MDQLQEADLTNPPSQATVYRWCKQFADGTRTSLSDLERSGRPRTSVTPEHIAAVAESIEKEPKQSLRSIAEEIGISKNSVRQILVDSLGMRKVCSVWVPHELSEKNRRDRISCARELIKFMDEHSVEECLKFWAVEDETWILHKDLKSKQENMAWLHPSTPKPRVVRSKLTNEKVLLILAFTGDGKCYMEYVAPGEKITSERYVEFMHKLGENWRKLRSSPTKLRDLWWQHDNARPHAAANTANFLRRRNVFLIHQSPYSPDFNFCDRWLFRDLKKHLRQKTYQDGDEICEEALQWFRKLEKDRFVREIQALKRHCELVISANGEYVV